MRAERRGAQARLRMYLSFVFPLWSQLLLFPFCWWRGGPTIHTAGTWHSINRWHQSDHYRFPFNGDMPQQNKSALIQYLSIGIFWYIVCSDPKSNAPNPLEGGEKYVSRAKYTETNAPTSNTQNPNQKAESPHTHNTMQSQAGQWERRRHSHHHWSG